jgi:GTP-binding protein
MTADIMMDEPILPPLLRNPQFMISAHNPDQWRPDHGVEVALAGRSNVGKSSAINTLTNRRGLARTSKIPGRTQQIVFFRLDGDRRLVDLPGYGYAKVPESLRRHWGQMIERFLRTRLSLRGLILLMDVRHPVTVLDRQMLEWSEAADLTVHVLLTKSDKLSRSKALRSLREVTIQLDGFSNAVSVQLFSSLNRTGCPKAREVLIQWLTRTERKMPRTQGEDIPGP